MTDQHNARTSLGPMDLESGRRLANVEVAYAHYGRLDDDGRNAILVTHGYTASHLMLAHGEGVAEGSWAPLIGPGRPLDTDRYFIVCSNVLGSSYGTTGPGSIDPSTGQRYGIDFPDITMADIVEVQHRLLQKLEVRHVRAVVGPSLGGFQALQWAMDHPDGVDAIGVVLSGPSLPRNEHTDLTRLLNKLGAAPKWNGGRIACQEDMLDVLTELRIETHAAYGGDAVMASRGLGPEERMLRSMDLAKSWAKEFDPHSLIVLLKAALAFDAKNAMDRVRANILYVISDTDRLFPPDAEARRALSLARSSRPMRYVEMRSDFGHMASGAAPHLWSGALSELLQSGPG